jgi:hypothetical protein
MPAPWIFWYWTMRVRPLAHSPFFPNFTLPTTVLNSVARMWSASFCWSRPLVASMAWPRTCTSAYE